MLYNILLVALIAIPLVITYLTLQHPQYLPTLLHNTHIRFKHLDSRLFNGKINTTALLILPWFVPVLYSGLFVYMVSVFYVHIHPELISPNTILYNFLLICLLISFIVAVFKRPITITTSNHGYHHSRYMPNKLIFFPGRECSTCGVEKPTRSKHCRYCGVCVPLYDHHCIWLNNCIGLGNYLEFYTFLTMNVVVLTYACIILWTPLKEKYGINDRNDEWHWNQWGQARYELSLFILCFLFDLMLIWFIGQNAKNIKLGMTTNELEKWGYVQDVVDMGNLYKYENKYYEYLPVEDVFVSMDVSDNKVKTVDRQRVRRIEGMQELDNVYDLGSFWGNLKERIK